MHILGLGRLIRTAWLAFALSAFAVPAWSQKPLRGGRIEVDLGVQINAPTETDGNVAFSIVVANRSQNDAHSVELTISAAGSGNWEQTLETPTQGWNCVKEPSDSRWRCTTKYLRSATAANFTKRVGMFSQGVYRTYCLNGTVIPTTAAVSLANDRFVDTNPGNNSRTAVTTFRIPVPNISASVTSMPASVTPGSVFTVKVKVLDSGDAGNMAAQFRAQTPPHTTFHNVESHFPWGVFGPTGTCSGLDCHWSALQEVYLNFSFKVDPLLTPGTVITFVGEALPPCGSDSNPADNRVEARISVLQ